MQLMMWPSNQQLKVRDPIQPPPTVSVAADQQYQPPAAVKSPSVAQSVASGVGGISKLLTAPIRANVDFMRAGVGQITGNKPARDSAFKDSVTNTLAVPKTLVEGIVASPKQLGKGLAQGFGPDVRRAEEAEQSTLDQLSALKIDAIKRAKQGFSSQEEADRFSRYAENLWIEESKARAQQTITHAEKMSDTDILKNVMAVIDVGLMVASVGVAAPTKAATKAAATATYDGAIKGGATKAIAAQMAMEAGRKELITRTALNTAIGGVGGAVSPYITKQPGTVTPLDVIAGGAAGAVLGGVLPGAVAGAGYAKDAGVSALGKLPQNVKVAGQKITSELTPLNQKGFARNPLVNEDGTPRIGKGAPGVGREGNIIPRVGDTPLPIRKDILIGDTSPLKKGNTKPDVLTTVSGRKIQLDQYNPKGRDPSAKWSSTLINAAIEEAKYKNDSMNLSIFTGMKKSGAKNLSQSDQSSLNLYLFGDPDGINLSYGGKTPEPTPRSFTQKLETGIANKEKALQDGKLKGSQEYRLQKDKELLGAINQSRQKPTPAAPIEKTPQAGKIAKKSSEDWYHGTDENAKYLIEQDGFQFGYDSSRVVGGGTGIDKHGKGIYLTRNMKNAKSYTKSWNEKDVITAKLLDDLKFKEFKTREDAYKYYTDNNLKTSEAINNNLIPQGYDGVRVGDNIVVFNNKNVLTKSKYEQLVNSGKIPTKSTQLDWKDSLYQKFGRDDTDGLIDSKIANKDNYKDVIAYFNTKNPTLAGLEKHLAKQTPAPQVGKIKLTPPEQNLLRIAKDVLGKDDADAWMGQYKGIKKELENAPKTEIKPGAIITSETGEKFTVTKKHIADAKAAIAKGQAQNGSFQASMKKTSKELGYKYIEGPVKGLPRVTTKAIADYDGDVGKMKDIVRGTIEIDDPANIGKVIDKFKKEYEIFEIKDNINASYIGYKDTKIVTIENGVKREIIIALPEMLKAKNILEGHSLYDQLRVKRGDVEKTKIVMDRLYEEASLEARSRVSSKAGTSASSIGAPDAIARTGAKARPVNKLVAKTSSEDLSKSTLTGKPSTSKKSGNLVIGDSPSTNSIAQKASVVKATTDRYGYKYTEQETPVKLLKRNQEFQPRTTESGKGTEDSVYKKGYNEGMVDQPLLLWKKDGEYIVLGGHSRTKGLERRAAEGLPNPESVKARVYENITADQAKEIARGANQGAQYENTLDMAKSISESRLEGKTPSVQRQNMIKGYTYDDYETLWDVVKGHNLLKNKIAEGGISSEEVLAVARQGRNKGLNPDKIAGVVYGLDKANKFSRQNAINVINILSGKIKAGVNRDAQTGLFGTVEQAINATDLLKEHQKIAEELTKKRNVLKSATGDPGVSNKTKTELNKLVTDYDKRLQSIETELINIYHEKQKKASLPVKTDTGPKNVPVKKQPIADNERRRSFIDTVIDDPNTPKGTKEALLEVDAMYKIRNTAEYQTRAANFVKKNRDLAEQIASDPKDDVGVFIGNELITQLQKEGQYTRASDLVQTMAKALTASGRMSQAASAYGKLTPAGALRFTQNQIDLYNKTTKKVLRKKDIVLKESDAQKISKQAEAIQQMPEGTKSQRYKKEVAVKKMLKTISETVPSTAAEKISSFQTMMMLLNPKTLVRNIGGNFLFGGAEQLSQAIGTPIDAALSLITGKRTVGLPSVRTQAKGATAGMKKGYREAKIGINTGPSTQYDLPRNQVFRGKVMGTAEKGLSIGLRGPDRAFYQAAYDDTLRSLMKVNKTTKPEPWMVEEAIHTGLYRTFQDDTILSKAFVGVKKGLNYIGVGTKGKKFGLGDLVLKFPKTPANLLARGLDYSPAGFAKALFQVTKPLIGQPFEQRKFVNSFSRAAVGSSVAFGLGYILADAGVITAKPQQDKDLRNLQKASGQGGYQINVSALKRFVLSGFNNDAGKIKKGDTLISYDWAQPMAIPMTAGAALATGQKPGQAAKSGVSTALDAMNTLVEQPVLTGVQKLFGGYKGIVDTGIGVATDAISGFVPTLSNQINQMFDNSTRETYDPNPIKTGINKGKAKIPGLAQTLPKQYTTLGKENERYQNNTNNPFNVFLNPSFITKYNPDEVAQLPLDIFNNSGLTVQVPRTVGKTVTINGQTKSLGGAEMQKYQKTVGEMTSAAFTSLKDTPEFMALSDEEKANKMSKVMTDINAAVKITMFGDKGFGTDAYNIKDQTPGVRKILAGETPGYSTEQIEKDNKTKAKTNIYSKYDSEVQDFYKLTKAEQDAMFAQDRAKATTLYDASKKMDQELLDAGVIKKPKYSTNKAKTTTAKTTTAKKTTAAKTSTAKKSTAKKGTAKKGTVPKIKAISFKIQTPKGVRVKSLGSIKTSGIKKNKLPVSKIPSNFKSKKLG